MVATYPTRRIRRITYGTHPSLFSARVSLSMRPNRDILGYCIVLFCLVLSCRVVLHCLPYRVDMVHSYASLARHVLSYGRTLSSQKFVLRPVRYAKSDARTKDTMFLCVSLYFRVLCVSVVCAGH
jgi:hypothetical protein